MDFWRFSLAGVDPSARMVGTYDPRLVFLSLVVASMAAYAALEIVERVGVAPQRRVRLGWLGAGSLCMGSGVWAMHFIGMMSFRLPVPMNYGLRMTLLSVLPAVIASGVAIHVLSAGAGNRWRLAVGGLLMAVGIGTMHYTGMEALRVSADLRYDPALFVGSILVAFVLATVAFWAESRLSELGQSLARALGGPVLGAAVCGMHYTAMRASMFFPDPSSQETSGMVFSPFALSVAIMVVTACILAVAVGGTWVDRRLQLALADVQRLEGLLPICANCKKIRDDDGAWQPVEVYVRDRSDADFTHSICPTCVEDLYPEMSESIGRTPK